MAKFWKWLEGTDGGGGAVTSPESGPGQEDDPQRGAEDKKPDLEKKGEEKKKEDPPKNFYGDFKTEADLKAHLDDLEKHNADNDQIVKSMSGYFEVDENNQVRLKKQEAEPDAADKPTAAEELQNDPDAYLDKRLNEREAARDAALNARDAVAATYKENDPGFADHIKQAEAMVQKLPLAQRAGATESAYLIILGKNVVKIAEAKVKEVISDKKRVAELLKETHVEGAGKSGGGDKELPELTTAQARAADGMGIKHEVYAQRLSEMNADKSSD